MNMNMNVEELEHYLEIYGPNLNHWPENIRDNANQFIIESDTGKALMEEFLQMNQFLDSDLLLVPDVKLKSALLDQACELILEEKNPWYLLKSHFLTLKPLLGFAMSLVIGIMSGLYSINSNYDDITNEELWNEEMDMFVFIEPNDIDE